jgi:hypothetical protein
MEYKFKDCQEWYAGVKKLAEALGNAGDPGASRELTGYLSVGYTTDKEEMLAIYEVINRQKPTIQRLLDSENQLLAESLLIAVKKIFRMN